MPKSFAEVYDLYNSMSSEGALPSDMSLSKFSTFANDVTGTQEFSEGAANSWLPQQLRKGSYWIDKGLEWTGLPQASGKLFSEIFPALGGSAEAGQALGESLPRGAVDLASFFIPGAGWSQGARMATAGAMSALHAFGDSGSPFDAAVAGVTPYVGGKGGEIATNLLAKTPFVSPIVRSIAELTRGESPTGRIVSQAFLEGGKDKTLAYMASQVGATASMEALSYAKDAIANKTLNPYEGRSLNDWVLEATMGNLPYMLGDVRRVVQTPAMAVGKQRVTAETPSAGERAPKVDITGVAEMDGMMRILDAKKAKSLAAVNGIADEALHKQEVDKINALHDYSTKVLKGEAPSNAFGPIWYGEGNQLKVASDALSEQPTPEAPLRQQEAVKVVEQAIQAMPETVPDALTNEETVVRTMAEADLVQKTSEKMEWDTGEMPVYDYPAMEGQPIEEAPPQRLEVDVKRTAETTAEALVEMGQSPEEALSSSVAGTKNATVEAVKKEAPARQINVAKMDAFSELEAAVKSGQADELAVAAYNEVMQAMQKPNANAKKLANAWFNWNHARLNEPREGVDLLGDLKGRLAITLVNEGKAKQLESNVWEADREGNNYAFTSKAEAQATVNELNAKLPKDAPYEYSSYTNRGTNSPSKTAEKPVGIKRKYRDEDTRKKTEFERNKVSPAVVAESKNAAEVITTKPKLPEDSIAKKVAEDSLRTFINKNARKLGMTNKDVQRIDALIASGQDPRKLQSALETMLAQKLTKEQLRDEESELVDGEDADAPDVINSDEGQGFEGDVTLRAAPKTPAGAGLRYRFGDLMTETTRGQQVFGGRLTLGADGTVPKSSYDAVANRLVSNEEKAMWELAVPQAFVGDRVNLRMLGEELGKVPQLEMRRLDVNLNQTAKDRFAELTHELDTRFPGWRRRQDEANYGQQEEPRSPVEIALVNEYESIESSPYIQDESATARYSQVNPWPLDVLQGKREIAPGHKVTWAGDLSLNEPIVAGENPSKLKFSSSHYPSTAGINQLAFVRGAIHEYQPGATLPDGSQAQKLTKLMEVWEVQSDWASQQKRDQERIASYDNNTVLPQTTLDAMRADRAGDTPLLPHWEPLAYKAAINEALAQGADGIVLSDAESAMMTEGHDKYSVRRLHQGVTEIPALKGLVDRRRTLTGKITGDGLLATEEGVSLLPEDVTSPTVNAILEQYYGPREVSQSPGMRAAYDERGPNILKKLTGVSGREVSLGEHNNSVDDVEYREGFPRPPKGSPVFKNSLGQPKTQNTGRLFDLTSLRGHRQQFQRDSFPLVGAPKDPTKSSVDSLAPKLLPTTNDALGEILRREGFTEKEVGVFKPFLEGVIRQFNVPDVRMGMIVNDSPDVQLHGLASTRRNMFWLAADAEGVPSMTKVRNHAVVMSHELGHIIEGVVKRGEAPKEVTRQYQNFRKWLETDPAKASEFLDLWRSELPKQYRDLPIWQDLLVQDGVTNLHPDELYANAMALWSAHKLPAEEAKAWQMIVPQPVRAWSNAITKYARKVISSLNGARFLRHGEFTQQFHDTVGAVTEMFDVTVKAMRESDKAFAEASRWTSSGTQDIYVLPTSQLKWSSTGHGLNMQGEQASAAPKSTANREPNAAQKVWDYAIRTTQALGAEIPVFRRLMNSLHNHAPDMKRMVNATAGPLWGGLSKSTGAPIMNGEQATLARMLDARVNFKLNELVSEAAQWWQQGHEQESFNLETFLKENPEWPPAGTKKRRLGDHYRVMNDMEKKAFNHAFKAMEQSHQLAGKQYVAAHEESGRNDMMLYMSKALPKEQWAQMPDLVRKFTDAMDNATALDPTTALVGGKSLDALRGIIGNDAVFQGAMDMWMDVKQGSTTLTDYFVKHPGHWSMLRGGNFLVRAYDANGKERADALDSLKDYDEWKRAAKAAGFTRFAEPQAKKPGERFSMGTDVLDLVTQLEQRRAERIQAMPLDEDVKKVILSNMDVSGEVARILAAKDVQIPASMKDLPGGGRRKIPGNMDMMESQKQFFAVTARLNASKVMRSRVAYEMTNPELARFPAEVDAFRRQLDNYMRPDSELSKALMSFNAHYFLAGNIPGMMTNLMQAPFTVMPELINRGVNPFRSTMMLGTAFKDMAKFTERLLTEKVGLGDEGAAIDKMDNADERDFFGWLNKNGHTNFGALNELTDLNSDAAIDLNRITQSGAPFKPVDKAKSKVKNFARTFMKAYAATEHFNLRLSALLGYRLAKQQMPNATKAELYESALSFMRDTTYAGGRANRPVAQGDLGAIGSMAYSLQSYTLGWLNQMARYIKHWKGADYLDLRPEERTQARNAALTMFGAQVGAAGVLGLPFVGSFLKLLENVTGVDYKGQLYTQLGQILDEDEQEGGGLANSILNGSANAMAANAGVPVDLGSRWSFNSILGFNAYDGFNGDAVFGPTGGVVSSVLAGLKDLGTGDVAGAAKAISPAALRKALTLAAGEGEVRTREGGLIPLSQGEKFAYALGFNPQAVSNLHKYRDLEHSREIAESSQERREAADILDKLQSDPVAANQSLQRLADASEGVESKKVIARRVARLAADETFPLDIRESMSRKSGQHLSQIAQMLGVTVPQANVVARTQHMNNILRMLGESPMAVTRSQLAKDRLGEEISPFAGAR